APVPSAPPAERGGEQGQRAPAPRPAGDQPSRVHAGENEGGPAAAGKRPPRRVVFDEEDDLDVPDFLKGP
ncbi:cell division protein FtsZ, partial [Actinomadura sp. LOL_016]